MSTAFVDDSRLYSIGIDVGGTHTDVMVLGPAGRTRGKAFTTYDDFSRGILDAITVAADELDLDVAQLLAETDLLINGTTVVTNIITQLRGARIGVLLTAGFRDTFRLSAGPRTNVTDDHLQVNVPNLLSRQAIGEVSQRTNWAGEQLIPLDEAGVMAEARRLVEDEGVEALAICFLNSHLDASHELQAEAIVNEMYPDLFVTPSHRVFPVRGETRRWTTALLNCFVYRDAQVYIDSICNRLAAAGLDRPPVFLQGLGGGISVERAKNFPLALLHSGPAGGALGANELGKRLGISRLLLGDMGGTSFDTGIIADNVIHTDKNIEIGTFLTGVNVVDVVSIGAGGGSVAWVSDRGIPQVGPQSMGSTPGPASYGKGGEDPTVTDAMIVLGFIDPENYLGGRFPIDGAKARSVIVEKFGARFGWDAERSASAVHDLVTANMANAVREVSVGKGYDPRNFTFLAYGGTLPLFAAQIAERLQIPTVVIPVNSSVFCAQGLHAADFVFRHDQTVDWRMGAVGDLSRVNETAERLRKAALDGMRAEGFDDESIVIEHSADVRFDGQVYELSIPLPARPLVEDDIPTLAQDFHALYERTYGQGTAWQGVGMTMLNYAVTARGLKPHRESAFATLGPADSAKALKAHREVHLPMTESRARIPIYSGVDFLPGMQANGPAIVDENDTTIFVPPTYQVARDEHFNYVLTKSEVPS